VGVVVNMNTHVIAAPKTLACARSRNACSECSRPRNHKGAVAGAGRRKVMLPLLILSLVFCCSPQASGVGSPGPDGARAARVALQRGAVADVARAWVAFVGQPVLCVRLCGWDSGHAVWCDRARPLPAQSAFSRVSLIDARGNDLRRRTWGPSPDGHRSPIRTRAHKLRSLGAGALYALVGAQAGDGGPEDQQRVGRDGPANRRGRGDVRRGVQGGLQLTTTRDYNGVLQKLARHGDMRASFKVLEEMDAAKLKRDVFTYNALLNCQSKARRLPSHEPAGLLASMHRDQVAPNVITLNTALKFYARTAQLDAARELVRSMQAQAVKPDAITYNTLLNICCKGGMMAQAESVLKEMQTLGMQPTASTVTTMIKGYGAKGAIQEARKMCALLPHDPAALRALASVLVEAGQPAEAYALLSPLFSHTTSSGRVILKSQCVLTCKGRILTT
jgi:pentatricopeptide repeat protein